MCRLAEFLRSVSTFAARAPAVGALGLVLGLKSLSCSRPQELEALQTSDRDPAASEGDYEHRSHQQQARADNRNHDQIACARIWNGAGCGLR